MNPRSLAGRDTMLVAVLESLRRPPGHGAVIAAEAGMGKTAVATAAVQELQGPVYWVYSSPALKSVPYGALAALLPDLAPGQTGSSLAVMRALMARFFPTSPPGGAPAFQPGREPLVVVDDAHDIDGYSLDLLAQLLDARYIRLLVLTQAFADISGILPHMWDGQLTRHRLRALAEPEVLQLCEQELQGQVSTTAAVELTRLTGGNPMYLLALIDESVRSGFLVQRHGVWVTTESEPPVGGRVGDLVKAQVRSLGPADRTAMETICLAEPLPLRSAFRLGLHASVDRLTEALLVVVSGDHDGGQTLRPLHPIYGEVVRWMVPAARSARLLKELESVPAGMGLGEEGVLRRVSWSLALGAPVPGRELLRAAESANNRSDPRLALRAAAAVGSGELRICARVQESRALLLLGETAAAAEALEGVLEQAPDLRTVKQAMMVHIQLALQSAAASGWAVPLAQRWNREIDRLSGRESSDSEERARGGAQMLDLLGRIRKGEYAHTELELAELLRSARAGGHTEAVVMAEAMMAEVLVATGRAQSALGHSTAAMELLREGTSGSRLFGPFVLHRHLTVLTWLGEWEQLQQCVASADSPDQRTLLHSGGFADFSVGIGHLRAGSLEDAVKDFCAAAEAAAINDPEGILPLSLALGSFAAGSLGHRDLASRLLETAERTAPRGAEHYQLLAEGILAGGRLARNSDDAALHELRNAAAAAQERSFTATEFTLRHFAMRMGDFSDAGRLLKVTEGFEGPQAPALNRVARAVVDQDSAALVALASDPDPELDPQLARQCLLEAQRLARRNDDRVLLNRIQRLLGRNGGGSRGALPQLTRRERDVAALVAAGQRNADIAKALKLSVRTVEGHIYRIYEKLGISRRDELKARFPLLDHPSGGWSRPLPAE
ncbi:MULTISPECIES: helix-turn-helix transcriptional regulator [unclassified Arthrobacter]|uniref:helix-turn-helix domain-containing protein n=1 Tax=unclassified Arthrobacter TaxID=235627 RepID=UPI001E4C476E|nr:MULTISPECIES: helix-turn-helix transcriptional regulator [unclassified Arthrobacter]MCC9146136.1 helix-turn-helix transcriptional regulator [Arthrobacter sp. zg-Y919]MDK1277366.1 helix-turn-helix transcriptional regulator [Arthrobacter sp. zg.Y919]WIB03863.1 helix-turn-helix transcriptional regulator [Arthrobacter sp. zg-Y919]